MTLPTEVTFYLKKNNKLDRHDLVVTVSLECAVINDTLN